MKKDIIWRNMGDMKVSEVRLYPPKEANEMKYMFFRPIKRSKNGVSPTLAALLTLYGKGKY